MAPVLLPPVKYTKDLIASMTPTATVPNGCCAGTLYIISKIEALLNFLVSLSPAVRSVRDTVV